MYFFFQLYIILILERNEKDSTFRGFFLCLMCHFITYLWCLPKVILKDIKENTKYFLYANVNSVENSLCSEMIIKFLITYTLIHYTLNEELEMVNINSINSFQKGISFILEHVLVVDCILLSWKFMIFSYVHTTQSYNHFMVLLWLCWEYGTVNVHLTMYVVYLMSLLDHIKYWFSLCIVTLP